MYAAYYPEARDYALYLTNEDIPALQKGETLICDLITEYDSDIDKRPFSLKAVPHDELRKIPGYWPHSHMTITKEKVDMIMDTESLTDYIIPISQGKFHCEYLEIRYDHMGNKIVFYAGKGFYSGSFLMNIKHKTENFDVWKERWKNYRERKQQEGG